MNEIGYNGVRDEFDKAVGGAKGDSGNVKDTVVEKNVDPSHMNCLTTTEERKEMANRSRGEWDGESGDSKLYPEKQEARDVLGWYKQDGIDYIDGEPDFSKVSEATVQIEDMKSNRPRNFKWADRVCANQWNANARDERTDWTGRQVKAWRKDNMYLWHERLDMKTMDLVSGSIHEECKHYGGIAEFKRRETLKEGGFDE